MLNYINLKSLTITLSILEMCLFMIISDVPGNARLYNLRLFSCVPKKTLIQFMAVKLSKTHTLKILYLKILY